MSARRPADTDHTPSLRRTTSFTSGDAECIAWHYPGTNGACVVMAGGFGVPKEPATDQFAQRFHRAGYSVLAFDYRRLGESGGHPRLALPVRSQLADWRAAIDAAAALPEVDAARIALWAFSASGGLVLEVAARRSGVAAVVAQTPNADGPAALRNATRHQTMRASLRFTGRALLDALGSLAGRAPRLVPLVGLPGTAAMLTTPDTLDVPRALRVDRYPDWSQQISARSALRIGFYRPGRLAPRIQAPVLVLVCDQDQTSLAEPAVRAAGRMPRGELVRMPGGHYTPFLDGHEQAVEAELAFLDRHLSVDRSEEAAPPDIVVRLAGGDPA